MIAFEDVAVGIPEPATLTLIGLGFRRRKRLS